jgi:hypothetical protein
VAHCLGPSHWVVWSTTTTQSFLSFFCGSLVGSVSCQCTCCLWVFVVPIAVVGVHRSLVTHPPYRAYWLLYTHQVHTQNRARQHSLSPTTTCPGVVAAHVIPRHSSLPTTTNRNSCTALGDHCNHALSHHWYTHTPTHPLRGWWVKGPTDCPGLFLLWCRV